MTEQIANSLADPTTTLAAGVTNSATTLTVASAAEMPSTGTFRLRIENEIILVGERSGVTCSSLTRGAEGTVAASHSSGVAVQMDLTAGGLAAYVSENGGGGAVPYFMPPHAGDPTGVVTPTALGYLIVDTTLGGLYQAIGATSADWIQVGGARVSTPVEAGFGIAFGVYTSQWCASGGATQISDSDALAGTGNGFIWVSNGSDGTQNAYMQLGAGGAFTHAWNADGSYGFPAALTGETWGVLADGAEYLNALSTPADPATGQRIQWYDDTTGSPVLRFKAKDAAGTLTAGVSLATSGHQGTVGAAGAASTLPIAPSEYIKVRDSDGNLFVVPAYAAS